VAKALIGWGRQALARGYDYRPAVVNGDPGVVFYDRRGGRSGWWRSASSSR